MRVKLLVIGRMSRRKMLQKIETYNYEKYDWTCCKSRKNKFVYL